MKYSSKTATATMVYGIEANILGIDLSAAKNDNSKLACIGTRELSLQAIYQRTHRPRHRVGGGFLVRGPWGSPSVPHLEGRGVSGEWS